MYEKTTTLFVCKTRKEKEESYDTLVRCTPTDWLDKAESFTIEFTNGSKIECIQAGESRRGKRATIKPYVNPYELYLDSKTIEEVLSPFQVKLTLWQKFRMKMKWNEECK